MLAAIPPGHIRTHDLRALGLADLGNEARRAISGGALGLADLSTKIVNVHGTNFPQLADSLRLDVSVKSPGLDAWVMAPGSAAEWGTLQSVTWHAGVTLRGAGSAVVEAVELDQSLLGDRIVVAGGTASVVIELEHRHSPEDLDALRRFLGGAAASCKVSLRELPTLPAPISIATLRDQLARDESAAQSTLDEYRRKRIQIDVAIDESVR